MGIISWIQSKTKGGSVPLGGDILKEFNEFFADICIRELAFWSAINIIANAVSKCEFKTFLNNKEVKGREYYLWNVEPNKNQNSSEFIHKLIAKLYEKNECLVIGHGEQLLVADSFSIQEYAVYEDIFTNVTVGDFLFNRTFKQSEVLYFKLSEKNMKTVTSRISESYLKLLKHAMTAYQRSRGVKGVFKYDTLPVAGTEQRLFFDELINEKFKTFMEKPNAILPLGTGQSFIDVGSKTYANESTRDIRSMIDDICDFTAKAVGVPPALIRGDVQGVNEVIDMLLTFCIDPLVDMISEEIVRKRYGYNAFSKGTYLKIDTKTIKHIDILKLAANIDKLISSGAYSVNGILKLIGEERIEEEWADKHFITKNYTSIEELLNAMEAVKGGEN